MSTDSTQKSNTEILRKQISILPLHWQKYRKGRIEFDYMKDILSQLSINNFITYHIVDVWLHNKFLDSWVIWETWIVSFIEFKKVEWYVLPVDKFQDGQLMKLRELEKRWTTALIACYSQKTNAQIILTYSEYETLLRQNPGESPKLFHKDVIPKNGEKACKIKT